MQRGGVGAALTPSDMTDGVVAPRPAFGDIMGGLTIAGGIAAALYKRKVTGETSVVDVSLLGLAAWNLSPDVTATKLYDTPPIPTFKRSEAPNPLVGNYKTKDGRFITLMMLQLDRFFAEVCTVIGHPELPDDPQVQAIGGIRAIPHPDIPEFRTVALPIQVDGAQLPIQCPPPLLGADTTDVLASLGYTAEQIADLLAQRVVGTTDVELAEARR